MKYIINNAAIVLFINGKPSRIEKTDRLYPKVIDCFKLPQHEQDTAILRVLEPSKDESIIPTLEPLTNGFSRLPDGTIHYNGERLPVSLQTKVESIVRDGLPLAHFEAFWNRLKMNPSNSSVEEFTDFLSYRELPLTEDGYILAYKGVRDDNFSQRGNLNTKVVQGTVDDQGRIYNGVGEVIEVLRRDVDDNRGNECSHGLHVGSLDYAKDWAYKVVVVKVDPADVVSVPKDCQFQKCRVSKYEVISEFEKEIVSSVVDEEGDALVDDVSEARSETINKIDKYLTNKAANEYDTVTIRQIQNSFSPNWISREEVIDALQELGYFFYKDEETSAWVVEL